MSRTEENYAMRNRPFVIDLSLRQKEYLKNITMGSLARGGSFATGLFCLAKLPEFTIGPECLLRVGSVKDQPEGLPSSPPVENQPCYSYHVLQLDQGPLSKILCYSILCIKKRPKEKKK